MSPFLIFAALAGLRGAGEEAWKRKPNGGVEIPGSLRVRERTEWLIEALRRCFRRLVAVLRRRKQVSC